MPSIPTTASSNVKMVSVKTFFIETNSKMLVDPPRVVKPNAFLNPMIQKAGTVIAGTQPAHSHCSLPVFAWLFA